MTKHNRKLMGYSLGNGILMLILTFYWLSLPYSFGDETVLIKWTSLVMKTVFKQDKKPVSDQVLFIDISGTKATIEANNRNAFKDGFTKDVVTDRQQLADLFTMVAPYKKEVQLLFLDVLLADSTEQDSLFYASAKPLGEKLLTVSHLEDTQQGIQLITPIFDLPHALATYRSAGGLFLKYPLVQQDSLKTIPLVLLERVNEARFNKRWHLYWINGKLSFPAPLVDFKVRDSDFREGENLKESNFFVVDLGLLLNYYYDPDLKPLLADFFKGRLIMVGDFENDMHLTPFGTMPGIVVIYNTYLTLLEEGNVISIYWMLFLLLGFSFISYRIFAAKKVTKPRLLVRVFQSRVGQFIVNTIDEALLLTLITILSYFIFHIHINILVLLIYIKSVEYLWRAYPKLFFRKRSKQAHPE